jgi:hypothetical protein
MKQKGRSLWLSSSHLTKTLSCEKWKTKKREKKKIGLIKTKPNVIRLFSSPPFSYLTSTMSTSSTPPIKHQFMFKNMPLIDYPHICAFPDTIFEPFFFWSFVFSLSIYVLASSPVILLLFSSTEAKITHLLIYHAVQYKLIIYHRFLVLHSKSAFIRSNFPLCSLT